MSQTSRTSTNEHLTAIKKRAGVWRTFFAPFAQNDNLWYTESFLDGKDAGELHADFHDIIQHAEAMAARISELEAEGYSTRISVVYPCCGAQEFWELNNNGELEMDHTEFGATCSEQVPTYQDRMDELRGQVRRLRRELVAVMPMLPRHIQTAVQRNLQPGDMPNDDGSN